MGIDVNVARLTLPSPATYSKILLIDFSETFFVTVLCESDHVHTISARHSLEITRLGVRAHVTDLCVRQQLFVRLERFFRPMEFEEEDLGRLFQRLETPVFFSTCVLACDLSGYIRFEEEEAEREDGKGTDHLLGSAASAVTISLNLLSASSGSSSFTPSHESGIISAPAIDMNFGMETLRTDLWPGSSCSLGRPLSSGSPRRLRLRTRNRNHSPRRPPIVQRRTEKYKILYAGEELLVETGSRRGTYSSHCPVFIVRHGYASLVSCALWIAVNMSLDRTKL